MSRKVQILTAAVALAALSGCRQDMHDQPKYRPLAATQFFPDGRSARPIIQGTVARGLLKLDDRLFRGKEAGQFTNTLPVNLDRALLERGRQRYGIYCTPCHGELGEGNGMVVQRGFKAPPTYHQDRLRNQPVGYFFDVMSNGYGVMASYASRIPVADRWAIAAYIRVLQLSQNATLDDVPEALRSRLTASSDAVPGGPVAPAAAAAKEVSH